MRALLWIFLVSVSTSAFGYSYFQPFYGTHSVASRWCEKRDIHCIHLKEVVLGVDADGTPMLTEYSFLGRDRTLVLWEGKIENDQSTVYGTAGKSANWTQYTLNHDGSGITESVYVSREIYHSPVWYEYVITTLDANGRRTKMKRTFKLR